MDIVVEYVNVFVNLNIRRGQCPWLRTRKTNRLDLPFMQFERNTFQVEDNVSSIFDHSGDRRELMQHAVNAYRSDGSPFNRRQQRAAQAIANGCAEAPVSVRVYCNGLVIYTGFSPNGDGKNDFFFIDGLKNYAGNVVKIYNRWGNLVFDKENYDNDWGGDYEGKPLPDGTYFYQLTLSNGAFYSGYLQIQR